MLFYSTIEEKGFISKYDAESDAYQSMYDLLSNSCDPIYNNVNVYDNLLYGSRVIIVKKEYVARPDLISLAMYGTDEYADIICKVNGLQNPFELNEDMQLFIPQRERIRNFIKKNNVNASEMIDPNDFNTDNISHSDRGNKKLLNEKRSPAEATVNDFNYILNKDLGVVFY